MEIYHTRPSRPAPFNFLNGTRMRIVSNKWDEDENWGGVGMGATHPEPTPLPSLLVDIIVSHGNQAKGMSTSCGLKIQPINWFSVGWGPYNGDDLLPKSIEHGR